MISTSFENLVCKYSTFCEVSQRSDTAVLHANVFYNWCKRNFDGAQYLSQEMINLWWVKTPKESYFTHYTRIHKALPLVRYAIDVLHISNLHILELPAFVSCTSQPHYFVSEELSNFFRACDELSSNNSVSQKLRQIIVPVIMRLLYSSGLRVVEVRLLKREDFDFETGVVNIKRTKGYFEHQIVLHDSMLCLIRRYDVAVDAILPNRVVMFPDESDCFHKSKWLSDQFHKCWYKYNTSKAFARELRHQYATENINSWSNEEYDVYDKLVSLKNSMGHTKLSRTLYYYDQASSYGQQIERKCGASFNNIINLFADYEKQ